MVLESSPWFNSKDIRPYVYVRPSNRITSPGKLHRELKWFKKMRPIYIDPLDVDELEFAEQIFFLEGKAFGPANMQMPRWVFFDCAVIPGFIAGFAIRTKALTEEMKRALRFDPEREWTPLSLFIIIPTMKQGEWVAHNLCTVNSLLPPSERLYGLGFLSKAFGLWYANVRECCGVTQWGSPSLKLHSHYGDFEILTAYTPVHTIKETLTYRLQVSPASWDGFFSKSKPGVETKFELAGFQIDPTRVASMQNFQKLLQVDNRPRYFLSATEISEKSLQEPLNVYQIKR